MAKKVKLKTSKTNSSPSAFLNGIAEDKLRKESKVLLKLFKDATGMRPKMWGYFLYQPFLDKLGPHKLGKSCLYLKSLEGIDLKKKYVTNY